MSAQPTYRENCPIPAYIDRYVPLTFVLLVLQQCLRCYAVIVIVIVSGWCSHAAEFCLTWSMRIWDVLFTFPDCSHCFGTILRIRLWMGKVIGHWCWYGCICNYRTWRDCEINIVDLFSLDCCGHLKKHVHYAGMSTAFKGYDRSVALDSPAYLVTRHPQQNLVLWKAIVMTQACWIGFHKLSLGSLELYSFPLPQMVFLVVCQLVNCTSCCWQSLW